MTPRPAARRAGRAGHRLAALLAVAALATAAAPAMPVLAFAAAPGPTQPTPTARSASGSGAPGAQRGVASTKNATFGIQPVTNGRIDSRTAFTYQTGPGGAYQDSFAVVNYSAQPVQLQVYAADLTNNSDGGLAVGSATDKEQGASAWIHLPRGLTSVNLAASNHKTGPGLVRIPFAWAVPAGAAAGDHTAAIVASLSVQSTGKNGQPVRLDQRVAARVFFRVSGAIKAQLSITDLNVAYSGVPSPVGSGEARVSYTLTNTGNVRLGAKQKLTSSAWLGTGGTPDPIEDQPLLLPGGSVHVSATVHHVLPGFRLTEKLHIDPVRAVDDVNVSASALDVEGSTWAVPWALIAVIVVVFVLVVLLVRWRRKRRRERPGPRHGRGRGDGPDSDGGPGSDGGPDPDGGPEPASGADPTALAGRTGGAR